METFHLTASDSSNPRALTTLFSLISMLTSVESVKRTTAFPLPSSTVLSFVYVETKVDETSIRVFLFE
jgi:hypothetical protein